MFSINGSSVTEMGLKNIRIDDLSFLENILNRHMTGKLNGGFTFRGDYGQWTAGNGELHFTALKGTYALLEPLGGLDKLVFRKITGNLKLQDGKLKITRLELTGQDLQCTLKGDIHLEKSDIRQSGLNLSGKIKSQAKKSGPIFFSVTGPLSNAKVTLLPNS